MVFPSAAWIRSSRSSKRHARRFDSSRPTVVLPAPMKPTSVTEVKRAPAVCVRPLGTRVCSESRLILAFLEVDFTTEGKQINRRSGLAQGACEGTSNLHCERRVLRLEGEIALHRSGG